MKRLFFSFFLLFAFSTQTFAALDSTEKIDKVLENFAQQIQASHIKEAVNLLKPHWPLDQSEMDAFVSKTKDTLPMLSSRLGKSLGFDKFKSCKLGAFIYRTQFIQKFEKSYVVWSFDFYNPGSGWILNKYNWSDQTPLLLDSACK